MEAGFPRFSRMGGPTCHVSSQGGVDMPSRAEHGGTFGERHRGRRIHAANTYIGRALGIGMKTIAEPYSAGISEFWKPVGFSTLTSPSEFCSDYPCFVHMI
jgi:hypothetical protein